MEKVAIIVVMLLLPGFSLAQEGFEADPMQPCLTGPGLIHACYPGTQGPGLVFGSAINWAHNLLKIKNDGDLSSDTWLVRDRVSISTAMGFRYENGFQFSLGMDWIAEQTGEATDGMGAPTNMGTGIGRTWIETSIDFAKAQSIKASLVTGLVFPSPNPSILAAPGLPRWKIGLRICADWWLFHPLVGIGLRFGEDQNFRDISRNNSIYWDAGLEFSDKNWSWGIFFESYGIAGLNAPLSSEANNYAESLAGARIKIFDKIEVLLGVAMGITGPGAPQIRPISIFRIIPEKIILENE